MEIRKQNRPLPDFARRLIAELSEPPTDTVTLESGALALHVREPSVAERAGYARAWYTWAREDWRPAAAFRRVVDGVVADLAELGRPDLHTRALRILSDLQSRIRELCDRDNRPATKNGSAPLALSACAGAWGDRPATSAPRNGRGKGNSKVRDGGHGVPRQAGGRQGDAQRGREVGGRVGRQQVREERSTPAAQ